jgi:hypothetical protein
MSRVERSRAGCMERESKASRDKIAEMIGQEGVMRRAMRGLLVKERHSIRFRMYLVHAPLCEADGTADLRMATIGIGDEMRYFAIASTYSNPNFERVV